MRGWTTTLNLFWSVAYCAWTSMQLMEILNHPRLRDCKYNNHSLLELNYVVIILCGIFLMINLICLLIYAVVTYPKFCTTEYGQGQSKAANVFTRILMRVPQYDDQTLFKDQKICMLCSSNFTMDCTVVPVPCFHRHYFHVHCMDEWMQETPNPTCPIC